MNFFKLFLMMALGVSLNNWVCGMERLEDGMKKISITHYDKAATQKLQTLLNASSFNFDVSEKKATGLITAGADPNIKSNYGETPLHWAARNANKEAVERLLKHGAHLNIKNKYSETPLYWAACNGHREIVEILLQAGAQLNIQDDAGWTPLHYAAYWGYRKVVESMINFITNGAQISDNKLTQLEYLCSRDKIFRAKCQIFLMNNKRQSGFLKIPKLLCYEFLLLQFWDPIPDVTELVNVKNNTGKTALDLAHENGFSETLKLLEPYKKLEVHEKKKNNSSKPLCILN